MPFRILISLYLCSLSLALPAASEPLESVDLIVRGDYVLTMEPGRPVLEDAAVVVRGSEIIAVDSWQQVQKAYTSKNILAGAGRILMPGLINGHTHSSMTLFRGMVDDLDLMDWLNNYVFPMEGRFVDPDFVRVGTELACWEMIRGGTTSFVDMYFYPEVIAGVVERCGLRAVVAAPHIDFPSPGFKGWDDSFAAAIEFVETWQGRNPRITPAFAPHAPYTVVPEHIRATVAAAAELNAPISMHLAEAPSETEFIWARYEATPIEHVAATGLLEQRVIGAHMVQLSESDIQLIAGKRVGAVHNPTSNMKLGAGVSPVTAMIAAGVNVGLGTDGAASNNDLDMWEEIRLAALLHKLKSGDPKAIPAPVALAMATRMGAAAIGLEGQVGQLLPGLQADLIQVDFSKVRHAPLYDVASHLVYVLDSQDVISTIVAGRVLMRDRQVLSLDEATLRRDVAAKRDQIQAVLSATRKDTQP
jgi:5-methylthioadenosine/S-adenosylhomocysteine deaminase